MSLNAFLPPSVRLNASSSSAQAVPRVQAHIMPFSIEYNGPAPVGTYLLMESPLEPHLAPMGSANPSRFDPDESDEAISSFRGRYIHGTRAYLPDGYKLGFFRMSRALACSEMPNEYEHIGDQPRRNAQSHLIAPPAPTQGSRFSLDDDEDAFSDCIGKDESDEEEHATAHRTYREQENILHMNESDQLSAPESLHIPDRHQDECGAPALYHRWELVLNAGASFWAWGPDGPVDYGSHAFLQTCNEWIKVIVPAVRIQSLYT